MSDRVVAETCVLVFDFGLSLVKVLFPLQKEKENNGEGIGDKLEASQPFHQPKSPPVLKRY